MKMKKFINAPETITDEELVGLGLAYPDILDVDGHLVVSRDLAGADRVTIVTYGGSGHEPAQAGFVGKGMLDVQAVGDIFAAPNGQLVFDAMKLADKGHGVLLLTLNYAGDQLAGKQAMKLAKKAGLNVRQVVTGEEIQYDPNGEDNKRGLAGAVVFTLLYGLIVGRVLGFSQVRYGVLAVYALLGALISQFGDLAFSYIKRQYHIKDYGNIFPGHGGVLDRFDSVIFCVPLIELLVGLCPVFGA